MEESGFMFNHDFDHEKIDIDMVNYQFSHQLKAFPERNSLNLTMSVEITPAKSNEVIAKEMLFCIFWINPFEKVIQIKDNRLTTSEPILIDTFFNIMIGAIRGLLVKNLKGTFLEGSVLPLIPMDIIRMNSIQESPMKEE